MWRVRAVKALLFTVWLLLAFVAGAGTVQTVRGDERGGLIKFQVHENGREGRVTCTGAASAATGGNQEDGTVYVVCITR